jgi:uncharacterized protein YkwD
VALPSIAEQEMLELVNRFRADPASEYARIAAAAEVADVLRYFAVDMDMLRAELLSAAPTPPLAWHSALEAAADLHSRQMIQADQQAHQLPGGSVPSERMVDAGYVNFMRVAENIFAYSQSVFYGHAGFVVDWGPGPGNMQTGRGHRQALLSPGFAEIGIGIVPEDNPATRVGPLVVTQNLGSRFAAGPQILGVVYGDRDGDRFYDAGEGYPNVLIVASGAAGTFTTTSWASGGYQLEVPQGAYALTFSGGPFATPLVLPAVLGTVNAKVDLVVDAAASVPRAVGPAGGDTVAWQNAAGQVVFWQMVGLALSAAELVGASPGAGWSIAATGDFNGDGSTDLAWRGATGQVLVWTMDGTQRTAATPVGLNPGTAWTIAAVGDFNGDGRDDLLWRGSAGQVSIWEMNGAQLTGGGMVALNPGLNWTVAAIGDLNGDGRDDVVWRGSAGQVAIWEMNGTALTGGGLVALNPGTAWSLIRTGDFDGDGRDDILWRGPAGQVTVWKMNGAQLAGGGQVALNPGHAWTVADTGDYDGDGRDDVLWRGPAGEVAMWFMDGATLQSGGVVQGLRPGLDWTIIA